MAVECNRHIYQYLINIAINLIIASIYFQSNCFWRGLFYLFLDPVKLLFNYLSLWSDRQLANHKFKWGCLSFSDIYNLLFLNYWIIKIPF